LINESGQKTIEILHNTVTIDNGSGTPFVRIGMIDKKHFIPINKMIELKNELLRLNIFQIEKDYLSISMEGAKCELSVRFNGKKISSKRQTNYPARWREIIDAIENCIKKKLKKYMGI
jgi:hypothetical protein